MLPGPAIAKQTECSSICVTLLLEDVRRRWHSGRKKPSWWMERDLGCFRPGRKPPSLVTRQPLGLPSFLAWRCHPDGVGARSHPKAKYEQGGESGKEERRQISLQTGGMIFTSCTDPASLSHLHAGQRCPGDRSFEVLERGVCHLLLLGTSPISAIVQAIVIPPPPAPTQEQSD